MKVELNGLFSAQLAKNLPKTNPASAIASDLQTQVPDLQAFPSGRGWDRTSYLPRVKRERMGTVGDKRGRLSGLRSRWRAQFPLVSPGVLTKDSPTAEPNRACRTVRLRLLRRSALPQCVQESE